MSRSPKSSGFALSLAGRAHCHDPRRLAPVVAGARQPDRQRAQICRRRRGPNNVSRRDGRAVLGVADRGPGIPEADRETVFDRFVRLEPSRTTPGNGLGLSLVRAVARRHNARVTLSDNPSGAPGHPGLLVELRISGAGGLIFPARHRLSHRAAARDHRAAGRFPPSSRETPADRGRRCAVRATSSLRLPADRRVSAHRGCTRSRPSMMSLHTSQLICSMNGKRVRFMSLDRNFRGNRPSRRRYCRNDRRRRRTLNSPTPRDRHSWRG